MTAAESVIGDVDIACSWAVAARTQRRDPGDLATLLDDGAILRTHVLRPTWHFVCADDIAWLVGLTGPRVQRVTGQQLRAVHGLDDVAIDRAMAVIVEAIGERGELTRPKLGQELTSRGISGRAPPAGGQFLMLLLVHAELAGLVCSGRRVDGEHTYALLADRAPSALRLDSDEALGELALRYACGHGPATERDLAYWASLTLGDARRGLGMVQDQLERFYHDGRNYWHAPGERHRRIRPRCSHEGICCRSSTSATAATKTPGGYSTPPASCPGPARRRRGWRWSTDSSSGWRAVRLVQSACVSRCIRTARCALPRSARSRTPAAAMASSLAASLTWRYNDPRGNQLAERPGAQHRPGLT